MKGKLIVIEGSDASGKATQTEKLYKRLLEEGFNIRKVEYPNYKSQSSVLVKMYLKGDFGSAPGDVNAYTASAFFAVDRFASYKTEWEKHYLEGGIVIADRYTTSNMVHQASKIEDEEEKYKFLDWLWDLEFVKFGLPIPNCVIFLDMPPEYSRKLMQDRNNKITGEEQKDIHEKDYEYLTGSYNNACKVADRYGWRSVSCVRDNNIKSIDEIHKEVYGIVREACV